ncbi:hypothetical protein [Ruegeria lacuscaerulensis]|uniref:hypothetical protein n=1 Tax=Ruegeria lacuscaerulensis TaxID=55218 RepID=UPI00147BDDCC|nr:hypothetical protein [Ruegeria lacuscaerulensis]
MKDATDILKTRLAALILCGVLTLLTGASFGARGADAGGFTACDSPYIFEGSAANIVPLEYLATSAEATSSEGNRLERLQEMAQRFSWLFKLDSWHQPTYGSLGVVAHMFLGQVCDPDEVLEKLLAGGASVPLRNGQVLVFMQGRIFIEDEQIFLQSRLRGFRRQSHQYEFLQPMPRNYAEEVLFVPLAGSDQRLSVSVPALDVTFAARVISAELFDGIDSAFLEASRVFAQPDVNASSEELMFEPGQPRAFSVRITNEPGWIEVNDEMGGHPDHGFIRVNPEASRLFHHSLPELDFLNGILGFLRLQQDHELGEYPPVPGRAPSQAIAAFERYLENELTGDEPELRALAHGLIGFIEASELNNWSASRKSFLRAAELAPTDTHYRNALGVTDAILCCSGDARPPYRDPARWFADAISVYPVNGEALSNLLHFLEFLMATERTPEGIDTANLPKTLNVVRNVTEKNPHLLRKDLR